MQPDTPPSSLDRLTYALDCFTASGLPTGTECPAFRSAVNATRSVGDDALALLTALDRDLSGEIAEAEAEAEAAHARAERVRAARWALRNAALMANREARPPCNPVARFEAAADAHGRDLYRLRTPGGIVSLFNALMDADFILGQTTSGCPGRREVGRACGTFTSTPDADGDL